MSKRVLAFIIIGWIAGAASISIYMDMDGDEALKRFLTSCNDPFDKGLADFLTKRYFVEPAEVAEPNKPIYNIFTFYIDLNDTSDATFQLPDGTRTVTIRDLRDYYKKQIQKPEEETRDKVRIIPDCNFVIVDTGGEWQASELNEITRSQLRMVDTFFDALGLKSIEECEARLKALYLQEEPSGIVEPKYDFCPTHGVMDGENAITTNLTIRSLTKEYVVCMDCFGEKMVEILPKINSTQLQCPRCKGYADTEEQLKTHNCVSTTTGEPELCLKPR